MAEGDSAAVGADEAYELSRLRTAFDLIPASTIINVLIDWNVGRQRYWYGCGVCQGEHVRDNPLLETKRPVHWDPKQPGGKYLHKDWCPRAIPGTSTPSQP